MRVCALLATLVTSLALGAPALQWDFERSQDITSAANLEPGQVTRGTVSGWTRWDPYVWLRLPQAVTDVSELNWLTVRLYSSAPADLLDIYYQADDGRWCLGGVHKIVAGWATYRLDLTCNAWRETTSGDASRQWGGLTKRLISFRIDPGNEAGRWVIVDSVRLSGPEPGGESGVTAEGMGQGELVKLTAPTRLSTDQKLRVIADLRVTQLPPGLTQGTAYVRLRRGHTFLRLHEQPVALAVGPVTLRAEFALSPYWAAGPCVLEAGVHELQLTSPGQTAPTRCELTSPRALKADLPTVKLTRAGGDPCLTINGQPTAPFLYAMHGGLGADLHREMGQAGVHLYSDWFGTSIWSDLGHIAPDQYDYAEFDRYFATILEADPEARFLPHLGLSAPLWWQQAHPEEMAQYADGRRGPPSFASERWKRDTAGDLRKLIAHLRRAPYASRIIGLLFYGGYTAEWQMWGTWSEHKDDYSAPALQAFRAFLERRYGTDAALRQAWNDPPVTLATAALPDMAQRRPPGNQILRDPATERQSIDFYDFISQMTADAVLHFARVSREATAGKVLVGTYYAYLSAHNVNQQDSGHNAAARVFDSPDLDFLMSPPNYYFRGPGETSTFMSATDSFRMRGKLWLDESDHRTLLSDPSAGFSRADNLPDSLNVFWREFAHVLCKRAAGSFFDMAGGWFSHPDILSAMGQARRIMQESLDNRQPFTPEVCLVVDPDSFAWMRPSNAQLRLVLGPLATMSQAGAPFDFCLLSDLKQKWLPRYKLYLFLNAFRLDAGQRQMITGRLQREGATALFFYAPGFFGHPGSPEAGLADLLAMKLRLDPREGNTRVMLEGTSPLARGLDVSRPVGHGVTLAPVPWVEDDTVTVHGRLVEGGRAALVSKRRAGWTCYYSAALDLPPAVIRNVAREAGVHLWLDSDDAVYTDGRYVAVHAAQAGTKVLHLPRAARVRDLRTGQALEVRQRTVTVDLKRAETVLLGLE